MKDWLNRLSWTLVFCVIELALVKFGEFAFGGIMVIFGIFGALAVLMGHKNFGWGLVIGTILFSVVLLLFGWVFMDGWVSPQEYFNQQK